MDLHTTECRTARRAGTTHLLERHAEAGCLDASESIREFACSAGRRVGLVLVCVVDDLEMVQVACGRLGEPLQQHDGQREVAAGENAASTIARQRIDLGIVVVAESRGADDDMPPATITLALPAASMDCWPSRVFRMNSQIGRAHV